MKYRERFSIVLSTLRKKHNLSLDKLASEIGITNQAVSLLEKGKRSPSFEVLMSLADYFDVSLDYLVGRSDDPRKE
ncbi:MAG: helix-turn-helix domain-containing protein [Christensenellales bacterium]|jgi:transcriptional regulator with XRE-family HTH domain